MYLKFKTDSSVQKGGFSASYAAVEEGRIDSFRKIENKRYRSEKPSVSGRLCLSLRWHGLETELN